MATWSSVSAVTPGTLLPAPGTGAGAPAARGDHTGRIDDRGSSLPFVDRIDAGRRLADRLALDPPAQPVVLGLPRGGVPVAYEVARVLHAPLDVAVVRKVRAVDQPELAIGAVGEGAPALRNRRLIEELGLDGDTVRAAEDRARGELDEQVRRLRGGRPPVPLDGRTAVVVDDGVATGATAREAATMARARGAAAVVVAVPVAPRDLDAVLGDVADRVVCLATPEPFEAVGCWYRDFRATSTAEVVRLLDLARDRYG